MIGSRGVVLERLRRISIGTMERVSGKERGDCSW